MKYYVSIGTMIEATDPEEARILAETQWASEIGTEPLATNIMPIIPPHGVERCAELGCYDRPLHVE